MTTVENNKIIHTIKKGKSSTITIRGADWNLFDNIRVQVKSINKIEAPAILDMSIGEGVSIDGENLMIQIDGKDSLKFNSDRLYFDVKMILDDKIVEPIIPGEIITNQTVTNPWS